MADIYKPERKSQNMTLIYMSHILEYTDEEEEDTQDNLKHMSDIQLNIYISVYPSVQDPRNPVDRCHNIHYNCVCRICSIDIYMQCVVMLIVTKQFLMHLRMVCLV